uniref:hypothetical protein n=1 Tax=Pseudomonas viridiflava TaxID=33069 RepID=UPI0019D1A01E
FFGEVIIEGQSGEMSVVLRDLDGVAVFEQKLQPVNHAGSKPPHPSPLPGEREPTELSWVTH